MEDKLSGLVALAVLLMGFVGLPFFCMKIWNADERDDAGAMEDKTSPRQREDER